MPTVIIGLIVLVVVTFALKKTIKDRKNGGCGGGCESCGGHCHEYK